MPKDEQGDLLLLGAGRVDIDEFDDAGLPTGQRFIGDCTVVELTTTDDLRERFSSSRASRPLMKSVNVKRTVEIAITFGEAQAANARLALMGVLGVNAVVASTGETFDFPAVTQDRSYYVGFRNITNVAIAGSVLDTDFSFDGPTGRVYIIVGGNIADGDTPTATFDQTGDISQYIKGGAKNIIEAALYFRGDASSGPNYDLDVYRCSITPDGPLSLIGQDFIDFKIKAKVLVDAAHPDELYRLTKRTAPPS